MLKKLRHKKTSKRILIVLAAVIIPAFAFWGFSSVLHGPKESSSVGKIFNKDISSLDYKDALDATMLMAKMQYGDKLSEMQSSLNLEAQAWERLILLAEARERKIKAGDKEVIQYIESIPFFQDKAGNFDNRLYNQILQYGFRALPRTFEEQARQNLIITKLYKEVTNNIKLTDDEIKEEYKRLNLQMALTYILAAPLDFAKEVLATDNELKNYYIKNSIQFKEPLTFNIEYVFIDKGIPSAEERIKELFLRLKKKEDFKKTADSYGLELKETGFFRENGPIPGIGWAPQATSLIAKTDAGKFLSPMEIDKYYYILKVKDRKEPYIPAFESIKDKVKEAFIKDKSGAIAREKAENCLKKLKTLYQADPKSIDLEQNAKLFGLKSGTTKAFKYGSYIEGVGGSDIFWTVAQKLKDNELSDIIEAPSGFYIIKVKSSTPFDEKKFEEDKPKFSQTLLLLKKQDAFAKFIEDSKRKAQRF